MLKIKSTMEARRSQIRNTQPGDIIAVNNRLWIVMNRSNEETTMFIRSFVPDENRSYENRIIRNDQDCAIIMNTDIKTIRESSLFNWVRCSIERIFKSRRFSQI